MNDIKFTPFGEPNKNCLGSKFPESSIHKRIDELEKTVKELQGSIKISKVPSKGSTSEPMRIQRIERSNMRLVIKIREGGSYVNVRCTIVECSISLETYGNRGRLEINTPGEDHATIIDSYLWKNKKHKQAVIE